MPDLFSVASDEPQKTSVGAQSTIERPRTEPPLAERLRPEALSDFIGQADLVGEGGKFNRIWELANNGAALPSFILWGPPGTGKTTLARMVSQRLGPGAQFKQLSAITSGVKDLKLIFDEAAMRRDQALQTILFVDEIHRFNKAQLDAFLPVIENGTITLIGATTENPSFELNAALLSRCEVFILKSLLPEDLSKIIARAVDQIGHARLDPAAIDVIALASDGDGRKAITLTEAVLQGFGAETGTLDADQVTSRLGAVMARYDKDRDGHYDLISALHKSVRGSDPDASLYWFARMLEGGEDPLFLARRLIRMASEDIGEADPHALPLAISAREAYQTLGSPEGELALAQVVVHLAAAPKSNAVYVAYKAARAAAKKSGSARPPDIIVNAPTQLMKDIGRGSGYVYDHDTEAGFSGQNYFPDRMERQHLYAPTDRGFEARIAERLSRLHALREAAQTGTKKGSAD
ncbi:MAG: replication-associated recombination protein A [Pseudomonadota bacterium]